MQLLYLRDHPEWTERAAQWYHEKWGVPLDAYRESILACQAKAGSVPQWYLALDEKGEIIGLVAAYLNRSDFGFISMLIVLPEYRRCRAAETLCEKVHMLAREKNISSIRGEIRKENMACRRLAERLGYVEYKDTGNGFVGVEKRILPE